MARTFNGTDQFIQLTRTLPSTPTFACWAKPSSTSQLDRGVWGSWFSGDGCFIYIHFSSGNWSFPCQGGPHLDSGVALTTNWTHLVGQFDGTDARIYVDGVDKGSQNDSLVEPSIPLEIGRYANQDSLNFAGDIAECALWDVTLNADEAAALAAGYSPLLVRPSALVRYLPLIGRSSPELELIARANGTVTGATTAVHPRIINPMRAQVVMPPVAAPATAVRDMIGTGIIPFAR